MSRHAMRHAAACVAACLLAFSARADDDARVWIERMSESLATRNYDGLFTHSTGRQAETMRIVHRVEKGKSLERLVSLDGSGREIVRTREEEAEERLRVPGLARTRALMFSVAS